MTKGVLFVGEELAGQADAFAGDVFARSEAELFPKPFEEDIAAEVSFPAEGIHGDAFGEVFPDILEYEMEAAAVVIFGGAVRLELEVLTLEDTDEQFFEAEIRIYVLGAFVAGADADELIDEAAEVGVVVEVVLVEVEGPVFFFVLGAIVVFIQVMESIVDVGVVYCERDALGRGIWGGFGEVDDHGLVGADDDGFAGEVVESGATFEVHDLFAADHAGDDQVAKSEGDVEAALIAFEDI